MQGGAQHGGGVAGMAVVEGAASLTDEPLETKQIYFVRARRPACSRLVGG